MPMSPYYKPMTGNVKVPGEDDPVDVQQVGKDTFMDFGISPDANIGAAQSYGRSMGARRPVTQSEIGADALIRAQLGVPDIPIDLLQYGTPKAMPPMPPQLSSKPARPAESYGQNRGGTGGAGRGTTQLGKSQFDIAPQFMDAPEEIDDKPWELDEQTKQDVTPGLSLTPKPDENLVDKEPDLQSPQGMYQALAKRYPDILTQNLDQLQQSRVTTEDVDALRDRSGLGSLFIAASKAASGAGSIGGKTAESIASEIVNREDALARQRLKDRLDVASENMAMNAKAVDLAMKQIDFADEREQYDPNSDVSKFARQFMKDEFQVTVPDNVPAYQLKQFLPAVVQKYQAEERAKYQSALLGQRTEENLLNDAFKRYDAALKSGDRQAAIKAKKDIAEIQALKKAEPKAPKTTTTFGETSKEQMKAEMDLAKAFSNEDIVKSFSKVKTHANRLFELARNSPTASNDEALIVEFNKVIDEGSVVKEGEFARTAEGGGLWTKWKNKLGRYEKGTILQPSQRDTIVETVKTILSGIQPAYEQKKQFYKQRADKYKLDPAMIIGDDDFSTPANKPTGGRSLEQIRAEKEAIRKQLEEIQKGKGK